MEVLMSQASRSDEAVVTEGLEKRYGPDRYAVAGIDLCVRKGEVYGCLGRNGAGKTTTMRMLVGLARPTAGRIYFNGRLFDGRRPVARIGALIEEPKFYPHLSGRANLRLLSHYFGTSQRAIDGMLEQVELADRADSKVGGYSLGMKQRLGVAAALLGDPEILVLDEPTNGLDPAGMADMRGLVRSLCDAERTVLLSSHLLSEVEQVCDRVGIIHDGRLVAQGSLAEVLDAFGSGARVVVAVDDVPRAAELVRGLPGVTGVTATEGRIEVGVTSQALVGTINRRLVTDGLAVTELRMSHRSLEDVFLGLTDRHDELSGATA
ncbi:MAG: transporter ATP-binding protein [Nonomuraea muscovyensis]|nr:transporter ATP-binding protein [Nonomuraea muscovyensis]